MLHRVGHHPVFGRRGLCDGPRHLGLRSRALLSNAYADRDGHCRHVGFGGLLRHFGDLRTNSVRAFEPDVGAHGSVFSTDALALGLPYTHTLPAPYSDADAQPFALPDAIADAVSDR